VVNGLRPFTPWRPPAVTASPSIGSGPSNSILDVARRVELELTGLDCISHRHSGGCEIDHDGLVPLNQTIREQLSGRVSNSRCSNESTFRQIESGVKNVEVSGSFATIRSTQPNPCLNQLVGSVIPIGHGLLLERSENVEQVGPAGDDAAIQRRISQAARTTPLLLGQRG